MKELCRRGKRRFKHLVCTGNHLVFAGAIAV